MGVLEIPELPVPNNKKAKGIGWCQRFFILKFYIDIGNLLDVKHLGRLAPINLAG